MDELRRICPVKWHKDVPANGISLGVADVDFQGPDGVIDFIKDNLDESFSFYQDQSGLDLAINSIVSYFDKRGKTTTQKNLQVIPGTILGIYAAMKYASRRDGDILCVGPIYEPIHRHATDNNNRIKWVKIENNHLDPGLLTESVDKTTKMIAICNPTNPIGFVFSSDELKVIRDLCVDYDIICFSDELYEPLNFLQTHTPIISLSGMDERTIALYGFSKAYGLAGYRSGFMYLGDKVSDEIKIIVNAQLVAPSPIASLVCSYALLDKRAQEWVIEFRNLMQKNTLDAANRFSNEGYDCKVPSGCFFVYPDIKVDDEEFSTNLLKNQGVQVVPGSYFGPGGEEHIRVNCATSEERLSEGIDRILNELHK